MISGKGGQGLFTVEEVTRWIQQFLQNAGYELQPSLITGQVQPDIYAKKQSGEAIYELAAIACQNLEDAAEGLKRLKAIKAVLGMHVNYVIVSPPLSEYFMIEFLTGERGKWYFDIKHEQFMVWICNPERKSTTCLIGGSPDALLNQHFVKLGIANFEAFINMRISQMIMAAEEEE